MTDAVNHPSHYTAFSVEIKEVIKAVLNTVKTDDPYKQYVIGNVIKYVSRASFKNGWQDMAKARFYVEDSLQLDIGDPVYSDSDKEKIIHFAVYLLQENAVPDLCTLIQDMDNLSESTTDEDTRQLLILGSNILLMFLCRDADTSLLMIKDLFDQELNT